MGHCGYVIVLLVWLTVWWRPSCAAQTCTVESIKDIQPGIDLATEKLDGHWYVNKIYDATSGQSSFSSFTVDVVPTQIGLTLYSNSNSSADTKCAYEAIELKAALTDRFRFSTQGTPDETAKPRTVLVTAANAAVQYLLIYLCGGQVSANETCANPTAFLVGRQSNPQAASDWLTSVTSTLPCFGSGVGSVVQQGEECPLRPFWKLTGRNCAVSSLPVQLNFNLTKYTSEVWREMAWLAPVYIDPSTFWQDYVHDYRLQPNGSITCHVSARDPADNKCLFYDLSLSTTDTPGKLILNDKDGPVPYNVIFADYEHYAIVFGCNTQTPEGECSGGRGWLWSRDVTLGRLYRLAANSLIQDLCINPAAYLPTEQNNDCVKDTGGSSSVRSAVVLIVSTSLFVLSVTA